MATSPGIRSWSSAAASSWRYEADPLQNTDLGIEVGHKREVFVLAEYLIEKSVTGLSFRLEDASLAPAWC